MSDKELDNYIKIINPDFNSHIEKGTIEMNNEYYNLLEEKMARLINQNQELKEKYLNAVADYETTMSERNELKKQLENIEEELELVRCDLHNRTSERDGRKRELDECLSQQKKFIKWLEDEIHTIETTFSQINGNYGLMNEKLESLKEILQKYKELIGDDKNGN